MSHARASHLRLVVNELAPAARRQPRLRFQPVVRLEDGENFGVHVETDIDFGDRLAGQDDEATAAGWLGELIERAGRLAQTTSVAARPISINAPLSALSDRDAPMAAEAGACRAGLLPQEVRIDFVDATVSALEDLSFERIDAFRTRGFRVGLDARRSWKTPMNARARMTFEAVRVDPGCSAALEIPLSRMEVAAAEGVALIAENVYWREWDRLSQIGVAFAIAPRTDG